ncbi:cytochrome c biogenesis protein CcsA [Alicyclobacillus cycloheptanicus]|uniref:HemX protein n=1 Tax=Alicyclobacillus cycloheptanicus TaxID=1457 RepID=A0ABT9XDB3_9BACL|nr:cytochrome c biogenesis protein CcsA [Alicyclobacillus cycloheptanicus]MDQ0188289.1 HemX protein [Alicyclobacillus cycloheptanicus]WDM01007.1 cytochrome c biogenesis protein CcsA [Alicyclobacillus cycloheptanicus]
MAAMRALYDAFNLMYALSLILFFSDLIQPRRFVNRTALVLLFVAFGLESGLLLMRLRALGYVAVYTRMDVLFLVSWLLMLITLVLDTFFRIGLALFFVNVLGYALVAFDTFGRQGKFLFPKHQLDLLVLHVSLAVISYVCFAFAFVYSFMYLIQDRVLRAKRWNQLYFRLPALERLDTFAFRSVALGVPVLLVAMVLGVIWGKLVLNRWILMDPKPLATLIVWLMYAVYLGFRIRSGWGGRQLAWYNMFCALAVLLNFAVVNDYSNFHHAF